MALATRETWHELRERAAAMEALAQANDNIERCALAQALAALSRVALITRRADSLGGDLADNQIVTQLEDALDMYARTAGLVDTPLTRRSSKVGPRVGSRRSKDAGTGNG